MDGACCACLRVKFDPVRLDNGLNRERWVCESCGCVFLREGRHEFETKQLRAALAAAEEKVASLDAVYEENAGAGDELTPLLLQGLFDRLSEVPLLQKACRGLEYDLRTVQKRELRLAKQLRERAEKAEAERDEARAELKAESAARKVIVGERDYAEQVVIPDQEEDLSALRSRVAELERELTREQVSCELECASKAALERWIIDQHPAEQDAAWTYQRTETRVERDALRAALAGAEEEG